MLKRCTKCQQDKPRDAFGPRAAGKDGLQAQCKDCINAGRRILRERDPQTARARERAYENRPERQAITRARHAARRVGISPETYRMIAEIQKGECAVCFASHPKLFLDHDHETGNVRGLLCPKCNIALGQADDDPDRLRALAEYVESHKAIAELSDAEWAEVLA